MLVLRNIADLASIREPIIVVPGMFDSLHLGHQSLIKNALQYSASKKACAVILTFDLHPSSILLPATVPSLLLSEEEKIVGLKKLGISTLLLLKFNKNLASLEPEQFIRSLTEANNIIMFCVGNSWFFGKDRKGNISILKEYGKKFNFLVLETPPVMINNHLISSSRIRQAIAHGNFQDATLCLGHPFHLTGKIISGHGNGSLMGFPTANLDITNKQLPPNGVYVVNVYHHEKSFRGIANIGTRPTLSDSKKLHVEVHILDISMNFLHSFLTLEFLSFVRHEKKFSNLDELKNMITNDVAIARTFK